MGGPHGQLVTIQGFYDFRCKERLQLLDIGVLASKVAVYVPAAANQLQFSRFDRQRFTVVISDNEPSGPEAHRGMLNALAGNLK